MDAKPTSERTRTLHWQNLQGVMKGQFPPPPFPHVLGLLPEQVSAGKVVFAVTASLCDTAMGCAVHTLLPAGTRYTTLDPQVRYVRPILTTTGRIRCVGTTLHVGRRSATAEARVTDEGGQLYAHATTSCMVFPPERRA